MEIYRLYLKRKSPCCDPSEFPTPIPFLPLQNVFMCKTFFFFFVEKLFKLFSHTLNFYSNIMQLLSSHIRNTYIWVHEVHSKNPFPILHKSAFLFELHSTTTTPPPLFGEKIQPCMQTQKVLSLYFTHQLISFLCRAQCNLLPASLLVLEWLGPKTSTILLAGYYSGF